MTENEAIEYLQNRYLVVGSPANPPKEECEKHNAVMTMAIQALEEVQQYRALGTPEECRTAMEKQKAKRPDYEGDGYADGQLVYDTWICPRCGRRYEVDYDDYDYCPKCGQKIEWRE